MYRRNADILAALGLTVVALLLVLSEVPVGILRGLVALPVTLIVPGYLLSLTLFPDRKMLDGAARIATIIGLNLTISVLGAILLHLTPWGLQPGSWALWLGFIIWAGSVGAWVRRQRLAQTQDPRLRRPSWRRLLAWGTVGTLGAIALLIAIVGTIIPRGEPFTQLWLLSAQQEGAPAVRLGVHNGERTATQYHLVLLADTDVVQEWPVLVLARGETVEWLVPTAELDDIEELRAELYLARSPEELYRHVHLRPLGLEPRATP